MATLLGIDVLPDRVRGVLVKTQLRRVTVASYAEVPIVATPLDVAVTHDVAIPHDLAPAPVVPFAPLDPSAPIAWGTPPPVEGSAALGAPSPFADLQPQPSPLDAPPPPPADAPRVSAPASPLSAAIAELLRRTGAGTSADIVASLPGQFASLRRIELPKAAEKKLDELLPFEMEALLPFDQADTLLDHQPIDADATQLRLLVCAATKSRIRETLDLLAGAGADPTELVPGAVPLGALAMLLPALQTEGPHVILSLRPGSTDVCVIRKGRTELARTLSHGIEALVSHPGSPPPTQSAEAFVREVKQTLVAWRMQGGAEPESISLAGEAAAGSGLHEWLSTALGRSVLPLLLPDPAVPLGAPDPNARHGFAMALGLALHATARTRHLDLRKGDLEKKRNTTFVRELAPLLAVAGAAVAVAFVFSLWARYSVLSARRELLEDELARVTETRLGEETRSADRARRLLRTGRSGDDPMPTSTAYDLLAAISAAVPEGVTHDVSRLSIDLGDARSGGRLEIQGTVGTIAEYDRLAEALATIDCLQALEPGPLTSTAEGRQNYRLEADIFCDAEEDEDEGGDADDEADDSSGDGEG